MPKHLRLESPRFWLRGRCKEESPQSATVFPLGHLLSLKLHRARGLEAKKINTKKISRTEFLIETTEAKRKLNNIFKVWRKIAAYFDF